jgi:ADP-ribosylation factor-binding protein GGA
MDTLGANFQSEVNKFKVLNELVIFHISNLHCTIYLLEFLITSYFAIQIRLVSKKFLGDKTPKEIQDRILDILLVWTDKYPELSKIKEAYRMLRTQGVIHEPQRNVIKPVNKKTTDPTKKLLESEKLKRLLQSKNQKDIEAANLMIQNMVRDNDRRIQMQNRRLIDLQSAHENAILLKEMLDEIGSSEMNQDTLSTLSEIFNNCVKLKPTVVRLAEETHESETFTTKIFETSELLNEVIETYSKTVMNRNFTTKPQKSTNNNVNSESLLDVSSVNSTSKTGISTILCELDEVFSSTSQPQVPKIDDLLCSTSQTTSSQASNDKIMELIKNFKAPTANDLISNYDLSQQSPSKETSNEKPISPKKPFGEIDSLVSGIMKSTLNTGTSNDDIDLNQSLNDSDDDRNLISENETYDEPKPVDKIIENIIEPTKIALKDIKIVIDDIEPSDNEAPRTIVDEKKGLKILVNFTKNRPTKDVSVIVITVVNQGSMAIENFQFDASVSKPCKLRILEASGKDLPGVKPFKQPTETINQVLLLLNPTENPVNMIAIVTYNIEGDDDPYKESFEVKNIPFNC